MLSLEAVRPCAAAAASESAGQQHSHREHRGLKLLGSDYHGSGSLNSVLSVPNNPVKGSVSRCFLCSDNSCYGNSILVNVA